jgi:hypothetical protein
MPQPFLCLDEDVHHCAERPRPQCCKPHSQDVVTILLECDGRWVRLPASVG